MTEPTTTRGLRIPPALRRLLRALHRDIGYLCVGLTFVYALSGLAVNHIADWDPNFKKIDHEFSITPRLRKQLRFGPDQQDDNARAAQLVLTELDLRDVPTDVYALDDEQLDITLPDGEVHVHLGKGNIAHYGQRDRFFLRTANYLHLNRGKKAWTYIADTYAVFLLLLASSGLFMLGGRKGLWGRGALFVTLGAAVPAFYVLLN